MILQAASVLVNSISIAMTLFLCAAGLTLLFGILRILNFAHGTFVMIGAYFASMLLGKAAFGPMSFAFAAIAAGAGVGLIGIVIDRVIFRRLEKVEEANVLIATFALMMVVHGVAKLIWGTSFTSVEPPAGLDDALFLGPLIIPKYSLFISAAGLLTFATIEIVTSRIWAGKILQSAAKDPKIMGVLGYNVKLIVLLAVAFSFFLAGLGGALILPNQALEPTMGDAIIIQAFAVVIIGGLGSVKGAFYSSLILGLAESLGSTFMPSLSFYVGIIAILIFRPNGLISSEANRAASSWLSGVNWKRIPREKGKEYLQRAAKLASQYRASGASSPMIPLYSNDERISFLRLSITAALVVLVLSLPWWGGEGLTFIGSLVLVEAVFAMSWNFLFGFAGLASFGHAGFFGLGAYLVAYAINSGSSVPFLMTIVCSGLLGVLVAAPIGVIALKRFGGLQLAILTLAIAEVFRILVSYSITLGRDEGIRGIRRPTLSFGLFDISLASSAAYFWFLCCACAVIVGVLWWLSQNAFGRALKTLRQDPERAAFLGIAVDRYRLVAFTISGGVAALAGALAAPLTQIVTPATAGITKSATPMLDTLLGGAGTFWGPAIGTITFAAIQYSTRTLAGLGDLLMGTILLLIVVVAPGGIVSVFDSWKRKLSSFGKTDRFLRIRETGK
jgi:branched-chain amino acid transport system permease protein